MPRHPNISLPPAIYARLKAIAEAEQRPMTTIIARALDAYTKEEPKA